MATIIAGELTTMEESERAAARLRDAGFDESAVSIFMLNAPGQHALHPVGGDEDADRGAEQAGTGAVSGAVVGAAVGLGAGAVAMAAADLGPAMAATATAVGAYTGSLIGAMNKTGDEPEVPATEVRHAGAMVAVNVEDEAGALRAADILREEGARQIERAEGTWQDGRWADFDPRATPNLIDSALARSETSHRPSP